MELGQALNCLKALSMSSQNTIMAVWGCSHLNWNNLLANLSTVGYLRSMFCPRYWSLLMSSLTPTPNGQKQSIMILLLGESFFSLVPSGDRPIKWSYHCPLLQLYFNVLIHMFWISGSSLMIYGCHLQ